MNLTMLMEAIEWMKKRLKIVRPDSESGIMYNKIIELLKEKEPIAPVKMEAIADDGSKFFKYYCHHCHGRIFPVFKYCPECGQKVKWDE